MQTALGAHRGARPEITRPRWSLNRRWILLVVPLLLAGLLVPGSPVWSVGTPAGALAPVAVFTVNHTGDGSICTLSACSLRGAILAAQAQPGDDTIAFNIPTGDPGYDAGTGQWTLQLSGALPVLGQSDGLTIDATTLVTGACESPFVIDASAVAHAIEITGTKKSLRGLVLTNAGIHGLLIHSPTAHGNSLTCSQVVSNTDDGVRIGGMASRSEIGVTGDAVPNLIAWNGGDGVEITSGASDNAVANNHIGVTLAGDAAASNAGFGVRVTAGAMTNTVGAVTSGYSNLISANAEGGVLIAGPTTRGNELMANRIGIDATGTSSLGIQPNGVVIDAAPGNTVGAANTISGNTQDGVRIVGATATGNLLISNRIGVAATGSTRVSNCRFGVVLASGAHDNQIGTPIGTNWISGNGFGGEYTLYGGVGIFDADDNLLCNNRIGTDLAGSLALPNAGSGVWISDGSVDNRVGTDVAEDCTNHIGWNQGCGVCVEGDTTIRNTVGRSSIFSNDLLGIDNTNGGNLELVPPVITSVMTAFGPTNVVAETCPNCKVRVYSDADGEGRIYEDSGTATATGGFSWSGTPTELGVTLLAIDGDGNTSEFSASPAALTLSIDDALPDVMVNKFIGDADGPADKTKIEIVAEVVSWDASLTQDISVTVSVPGNLFGPPAHVFARDDMGELTGTALPWSTMGGGAYRADAVDLSPVRPGIWRRRVVFRFEIPHWLSPQQITASGLMEKDYRPIRDPADTAEIQLLGEGDVGALILTNRTLLYAKHTEAEVTGLLNQLYTEAQGTPASHSPLSAITYVDAYSPQARNWDNTSIDYSSESTANEVARAIDGLLEDWQEDGMETVMGFIPIAWPTYLLIVGDDDVVPFWRYDDPKDDEAGWSKTSSLNPAVYATDLDYFFTDNPYGDVWGTDWSEGNLEAAVGRLLGETAGDMLGLLMAGVDPDNGQRGGAVMASVSGWEVGYEPHDPSHGGVEDIADVAELFRDWGFEVRNDEVPNTEIRTLDLITLTTAAEPTWNAAFVDAANDPGGMDLFYIGGHNGHDHATIPGDNFTPNRTCSSGCNYERFDDDHPVTVIMGCHGGLPVPDIDLDGGADHNMVFDVIREGGRAYIGATGYSYGTMDFLHSTECGELLTQHFFDELLSPVGSNSMTIGYALARAKRAYTFGYVSDAADRKTVSEYQVYGVPWAFLTYPTPSAAGASVAPQLESDRPAGYSVQISSVSPLATTGTYTRGFVVNMAGYDVVTRSVGGADYHLLPIAGGSMAVSDGSPVLPYLRAFTLTLPVSGTVSGVDVTGIISQVVGPYNVPTAEMRPFTEGGTAFTSTTTLTGLYPTELVAWQRIGDDLLFTVYPIQHDPATGETVYHSQVAVEVTYETPSDLAVSDVAVDREVVHPGDPVTVRAIVTNLSDAPVSLTATLALKGSLGTTIGVIPANFGVQAGARVPYSQTLPAPTEAGPYQLVLTVWQDGVTVGGGAVRFGVVDGRVWPLVVPETVTAGRPMTVEVGFENYRTSPVSAQVRVVLRDDHGVLVGELGPKPLEIPGSATASVLFHWLPPHLRGRTVVATAIVTVGDQAYGPMSRPMTVNRSVFLPVVMRGTE